jgi:hypothetical protein
MYRHTDAIRLHAALAARRQLAALGFQVPRLNQRANRIGAGAGRNPKLQRMRSRLRMRRFAWESVSVN